MIFYVMNAVFPENSGFSKRCLREIRVLSDLDEVMVICRKNKKPIASQFNGKNKVTICGFEANQPTLENLKNYKTGLYEIKRNFSLIMNLCLLLVRLCIKHRNKKIKIIAVTSPLTVPLVCTIIGTFFRARLQTIIFHDLEPELAIHLKKLKKGSLILILEEFLEWFELRLFQNCIVTTNSQKLKLLERTKLNKQILVIPNTVDENEYNFVSARDKDYYLVGYFSTINFSYSYKGFIEFLKEISKTKTLKKVKILLVGNGPSMNVVEEFILNSNMKKVVLIERNPKDTGKLMSKIDIGLIPWLKDEMTVTMLPTKFFEYVIAKKAVIAPNFGEFQRVVKNNVNGVLFNSIEEIPSLIENLLEDSHKKIDIEERQYQNYQRLYSPDIIQHKLASFFSGINEK